MRATWWLPLLAGCAKQALPTPEPVTSWRELGPCGAQVDGSRVVRVLHLNDVYRIEGLLDGRGGLPRLRTLRAGLEATCPSLIVTHAGDALYPSFLSRTLRGQQMVDGLSRLDGDPAALDSRLFFTFGNHEFDKGRTSDAPHLDHLVEDGQFAWLDTNLTWATGDDGQGVVASEHLADHVLLDQGDVQIGLFGLTVADDVRAAYVTADPDYATAAGRATELLRGLGADVVIAVTHLDEVDDVRLLETLGDAGPDVILGGHDHAWTDQSVGPRRVLKGDADAVRVPVVDLRIGRDGVVTTSVVEVPVDASISPDPDVQAWVDQTMSSFATAFCGEDGPMCLGETWTTTSVELVGDEERIRRYETNVGDWLADLALDAFRADGAQMAFLNSGGMRLNQNIAPGTPIGRRVLEELFAYPTDLHLLEVSGAVLQQVASRSVEDWSGNGHWLQIAGFAFRHDPHGEVARDLHWMSNEGPILIDPAATYRVVTNGFLVNPDQGQDGYTFLNREMWVTGTANDGVDLRDLAEASLKEAGASGFSPRVDGRICNLRGDGPCLLGR
jgi:2',3'-cyclic-nucleotide 2'-phosphodiesterase (5'-nucleotidase family)